MTDTQEPMTESGEPCCCANCRWRGQQWTTSYTGGQFHGETDCSYICDFPDQDTFRAGIRQEWERHRWSHHCDNWAPRRSLWQPIHEFLVRLLLGQAEEVR